MKDNKKEKDNKMKDNKQTFFNKNRTKRHYKQPQLQVYGDLRNITQATGVMGAKDGGKGSSQKTH